MPFCPTQIDDDPNSYGSKGQSWNATFIECMKFIVLHPSYAGMQDALKDGGKIQWEASSNRSGGQYKDPHHHRRDWWRAKVTEIGIDVRQDKWISLTAKTIHPSHQRSRAADRLQYRRPRVRMLAGRELDCRRLHDEDRARKISRQFPQTHPIRRSSLEKSIDHATVHIHIRRSNRPRPNDRHTLESVTGMTWNW